MDVKVRNKVAEIQRVLEQDEQRISLSDPVAKMMLVALAYQSCEIERKMEQTVARLSEHFCDQVLLRSNLKAQPAVTVLGVGNGGEYTPYFIDENDVFAYKPARCNFRPRPALWTIACCSPASLLFRPHGRTIGIQERYGWHLMRREK